MIVDFMLYVIFMHSSKVKRSYIIVTVCPCVIPQGHQVTSQSSSIFKHKTPKILQATEMFNVFCLLWLFAIIVFSQIVDYVIILSTHPLFEI